VHAAREQRRRYQAPVTVAAQHRLEIRVHVGADRRVIDAHRIDQALDRVDIIRKACLPYT
jgi:hypothetical protein